MPFPLAHPALVIPLWRRGRRYLSLPALVIGSLVPDIGYLFKQFNIVDLAHRFAGTILFCVPAGLIALLALHCLTRLAVKFAPNCYGNFATLTRRLDLRTCNLLLVSLWLGSCTHVVWDSFTHAYGWASLQWSWLQQPLCQIADFRVRTCHLLWYLSSFWGVSYLYVAMAEGLEPKTENWRLSARRWQGTLAALLILPLELMHHFAHPSLLFSCFISLAAGALMWMWLRVCLRRSRLREVRCQ